MDKNGVSSHPKRIRLHHILFIGFTLISTIPVLFLAAWVQKSSIENEYSAVKDKHLLLARNLTGTLSQYVADAEIIFRVAIESLASRKSVEQIPALLKIVNFDHICITDKTGRVRYITTKKPGKTDIIYNEFLSPRIMTKLEADIEKAKSSPGRIIFSSAMHNSQGKPTLYLIKAELDGAIAIGGLETDYIVNIAQKISFGVFGHAAIVDNMGKVLSHPNAKWRAEIKDLSKVKPVAMMMANQSGVTTFYSPALKADMVAGFTTLPKVGWGVMIPQPISELKDHTSDVSSAVLTITLLGIAFAAAISWWLARYLSLPMQAVVQTASDITAGKFNARVPSFHGFILRESSDLIQSFNSMVDQLGKVERRLRTSEERFKEFASTASDWLWEINAEGQIIWESASKINGYRGRKFYEIQGKTCEELAGDLMTDLDWKPYHQAIENRAEIKNFEYLYYGDKGRVYHALINGIPLFDEQGNFSGYRGSATNITERKKTEAALKKAKNAAEEANKSKSEFLANMSHDLRTPLNAIIGFSDIMRRKTFGSLGNPRYDEYACDIHNSGTLLISLINDILDLSKIEAGKYELSEEILEIDDLVKISFRQLQVMAETSNQELTIDISPNLPAFKGDKRAMIQILNNLISNAIKYSPEKGKVHVWADVNINNCITLSIKDTGMGMSEEDLGKAMQAFEQINHLNPRKHEGTGLGLYLCTSFMKLFGGSLEIDSELDNGTTVTLQFPPHRTLIYEEESRSQINCI